MNSYYPFVFFFPEFLAFLLLILTCSHRRNTQFRKHLSLHTHIVIQRKPFSACCILKTGASGSVIGEERQAAVFYGDTGVWKHTFHRKAKFRGNFSSERKVLSISLQRSLGTSDCQGSLTSSLGAAPYCRSPQL